ncbi:uncharacterized protein LOC103508906 [Diaphorina citri]|uniref:Uncharacterized protein LOC103508906 n=1 Tax=Diaphorina citri TaxID=121845 RepID=A0A3Q0IXN4_DIACI|nr:uncharacterized protein LOC103508906 [Diaphorina citri]
MTTPSLPFIPRPPANFTSYGRLAPADPDILASIMRDPMKAINIDNIPRPIRFYGHTGIVFLSWDDPREIGFMKGVRKITIDGTETVLCQLNAPYKEFMIDGAKHRIRLGNPTREPFALDLEIVDIGLADLLYIDDDYHECCFGGPPLRVDIGGKSHLVQLEGPPPTVTIDTKKRTDLCAGRVDLYIDDKIHVDMFLDCKPHKVSELTRLLEEPSEPTSVDEEMKPIPEEPLDQVKSEEVEAPAADTETENEKPQDEEIKEPSEPLEDMESAKESAEEMDESSFELKESDTNEDVKDEKESKPETGELLGDEISPRITVMTTTDIDGNIQGKPTVPSSLPAPAKIKINITKTVLPGNIVKPIEPVLDEASSSPKQMETDIPQEDANATPLNQPKSVKPLIASKKMTHYPPLSKGKDLSALCSIM